jgi:hypothetical protein
VRDGALNSPRFAQNITAPITAIDSSSTTTATIHPDRDLSLFLGLSRVSLGVSLMVPISRLGADRSAKATDPAGGFRGAAVSRAGRPSDQGHRQRQLHMQSYCPFGSCSNMDDSETFKALQMSKRRRALTRFFPLSYF